MSAHNHATFVEGCYRCDLSLDELTFPYHDCDDEFVDQIACPEPCGIQHTYCSVCHDGPVEECLL